MKFVVKPLDTRTTIEEGGSSGEVVECVRFSGALFLFDAARKGLLAVLCLLDTSGFLDDDPNRSSFKQA
jgi:hypothetical protein